MKCLVSGCSLELYAKGYCKSHYNRWHSTGDPGPAKIRSWSQDRKCSVEGCDSKHFAHGYCNIHWHRMERHGDPLRENIKTPDGEPAAFIENAIKYKNDNCLIWPYSRNDMGYAKIATRKRNGKPSYAYVTRIVCTAVHGKPPKKYEAAHNCGGGHLGCVNPMHLEWKTHQDNCLDTVKHDRSTRGERNPGFKLTASDVRRIRKLIAGDEITFTEIAKRFEVNSTTISDIANGRTWSWLN
jgi:hypothetical protein